MTMLKCEIRIKKKVARGLARLPGDVQKLFYLLVADLQADGAKQKSWRNFSPLGGDRYGFPARHARRWRGRFAPRLNGPAAVAAG
jgi:hypothetical protein